MKHYCQNAGQDIYIYLIFKAGTCHRKRKCIDSNFSLPGKVRQASYPAFSAYQCYKNVLLFCPIKIRKNMSLSDNYGRMARYLRLSVTDRCNFHCLYCRDKAKQKYISHKDILRYDEMLRLVGIVNKLGIGKVRITGGEPFIRKDLTVFLETLRTKFPEIALSITTNASLLAPYLPVLKKIHLSSLNISLDSLDSKTFANLTGKNDMDTVLSNMEAALAMGIKIKINAVAIRGITDIELDQFLYMAKNMPVDIRFIEFMPLGSSTLWNEKLFLSTSEIFKSVSQQATLLQAIKKDPKSESFSGPAKMYEVKEWKGRVGFISAMSNHFCERCNRLRITAKGALRTCLFADKEYALNGLLRHPKITDDNIAKVIRLACTNKPLGSELMHKKQQVSIIKSQMASIGG